MLQDWIDAFLVPLYKLDAKDLCDNILEIFVFMCGWKGISPHVVRTIKYLHTSK